MPTSIAPPLGFEPRNKYLELKELRDRIRRRPRPQDDLGRILQETVDQYMVVIEMLAPARAAGLSALQPATLRLGERSPAR